MGVVIRLKVPIEMHYTVIPMGTSKVNSSQKYLLHIGNAICTSGNLVFCSFYL